MRDAKKTSMLFRHLGTLLPNCSFLCIYDLYFVYDKFVPMIQSFEMCCRGGMPGWLSWLHVWLRLRSWSRSLWFQAPCRALCWQLRAWRLFRFCVFFLSPSPSHAPFFYFIFYSRIKINIKKLQIQGGAKMVEQHGSFLCVSSPWNTARPTLHHPTHLENWLED